MVHTRIICAKVAIVAVRIFLALLAPNITEIHIPIAVIICPIRTYGVIRGSLNDTRINFGIVVITVPLWIRTNIGSRIPVSIFVKVDAFRWRDPRILPHQEHAGQQDDADPYRQML